MSLSLALTALLGPPEATAAPHPAPSVELRMTSVDDGAAMLLEQALMRRLGDRLLEDGYRVVPAGDGASVRVWIHLDADGARIEARGAEQRVETVSSGDPQIVALEIQQLTTALIDEVRPSEAVDPPAVVLQLVGEGVDPQVRERLQAGLLGRGFALTRQPRAGDVRLCVSSEAAGTVVHVVDGEHSCERGADTATVSVAAGDTVELQREHLLDSATEALRRATPESSASTSELPRDEPPTGDELPTAELPTDELPTDELPADEVDDEVDDEAADEPPAASLTLAAYGGLAARFGGPDPAIGLRIRGGRQRGIGGAVDLMVMPSRGVGVRVVEVVPTAAIDWRIGFSERGLVALGAFAGVHLHSYAQAGTAGQRGLRVAPSVGANVSLAYLGPRGLTLFGGLRGGWSGGQWVHVFNGETTWRRSGLLLGLELGVGWDFALGGAR